MKEKLRLYVDALLYGDAVTKRYLYGVLVLTLLSLVLGGLAVLGAGMFYGFSALGFAFFDLIWWQSMTLTEEELIEQGDKEASEIKKAERQLQKKREKAKKAEEKKLKKDIKEVKKRQDKLDKEEEKATKKLTNSPYTVSEAEVRYILKKSRVKKDHREVMIDHCDSLSLKEAPAYIWKDRKKYHLLVVGDGEPLQLDYPISFDTVVTHENGLPSEPDKEYLRFKYPSFLSVVFEPFLPDYYEKSTKDGRGFYKNLYRLGEDMYFTNTSAKNVFDMTRANFKVADEITKESAHGEDFVNVYKANILWRDGVLSSEEYKDRITEILGSLARADVGTDDFLRILNRMYEYNLITKAYVEFYLQYRAKYRQKKK